MSEGSQRIDGLRISGAIARSDGRSHRSADHTFTPRERVIELCQRIHGSSLTYPRLTRPKTLCQRPRENSDLALERSRLRSLSYSMGAERLPVETGGA